MSVLIDFSVWFVASVVMMSFLEHQVHRRLMHKSSFLSNRFSSWKRIFQDHAVLHHGRYYKVFDHEPDEEGRDLNLHLNVGQGFIRTMPLWVLLAFISIPGAVAFVTVLLLHHLTWNTIHEEMHKPQHRFFSNWGIYKFLARHHYMHHKAPGKNFNVVLPLFDYILGTHIRASEEDFKAMHELGLVDRREPVLAERRAPVIGISEDAT